MTPCVLRPGAGVVRIVLLLASCGAADLQWIAAPGLPGLEPRYGHALAHDSRRGRTLLFGGWGAGGDLGDTWEWDGTSWTELHPPTSPAPRSGHGMAYDSIRGRVLLFGGSVGGSGGTLIGDTWDWDGTNWTQRFPAASPSPRTTCALAYDSWRGVIVLHGGAGWLADTWEWDGTNWGQAVAPTSPPARVFHALAYDPVRRRTVLFGGLASSNGRPLGDIWEWDGATWISRPPAGDLPPRWHHAMTYDPRRGRVLLFGGSDGMTLFSDIWEWDGTRWISWPVAGPVGRWSTALTYDVSRGRAILFGGHLDGRSLPLSDTWEWDGTTWHLRFPAAGPGARLHHAMAYDPARRRAILFGGAVNWSDRWPPLGDTWEWDGTVWSPRLSAASPQARFWSALAYDARRGRTVLFGGCASWGTLAAFADTWEWDGTSWARRVSATSPPARYGHALAFDMARGRTVLFGGCRPQGSFSDTWEWDGTNWSQRFPVASPPALCGHAMVHDATRARTVLYGGGATWEWDGTDWTLPGAVSPPSRTEHGMAFDAARGRAVVFGGRDPVGTLLSETWEWDGANWTQRFPAAVPSARAAAGLVFDAGRGRTLLYGGAMQAASTTDTWELAAPFDPAGPGHPGGGLSLACAPPPRVGASFSLTFSDPPPRGAGLNLLVVGPAPGLRPPIALAPPPACAAGFLHAFPDAVLVTLLDPAVFTFSLPANQALAGLAACVQGAALETGACLRMTDALVLTVQP